MKLALAMVMLLAMGLSGAAGEGSDDPAASIEKERQAGKAFVDHFREQYGASTNARYRAVVAAALARLRAGADARPELEWRAEILRSDPRNPVTRNASAWPGGYLLTDDAFMRLIEEEAGGKPDRMEALAAGVLAHEMGHVLHHDTDLLVRLYFQKANAEAGSLATALASARPAHRLSAAEQRRKEELADHDGAFLLLRAGYRIEDMVSVFRRLAREDVGEVLFTGELDHAKAADRVAYLLRIEAEVVEDQTRYDEAVTVVRLGLRGPSLESAIRSLEWVGRHFPGHVAVRHALAAAYHSDYLASVPVAGQRFRPAFAYYRFEASRDAKESGPREERLRTAANIYQEILRRAENSGYRGFGPTASAHALALAHLGRLDEALRWARKGVELAPGSWPALNTLGNVLQLRGDAAGALDAYSRSLAAASARYGLSQVLRAMVAGGEDAAAVASARIGLTEFAPIYFNLAAASQEAGKTREAGGLLRLYLGLDRDSEWSALARSRLGALGVPAVAQRITGVAGVQVTDARFAVEKAWGPPTAQGTLPGGARVLKYPGKGLTATLDAKECVSAIGVQSGFRGDLGAEGVALGAPAERVEGAYGPPMTRVPAGAGVEAWDYPLCGVTFMVGARGVERAVIYGRPEAAMAPEALPLDPFESGFAVVVGDSRAQVRAKLGDPDRIAQEGVWLYNTRGIRVRFAREGRADLVVVSRPCADALCGIRIGDSASKIEAALGEAQATANLDDTVTYAFPARGVAYVVQDGQVTAMVLYLSPV